MNFSEPTKATLYGLRRIAGDLLLIAPDQFALLGKDESFAATASKKRRQHAGLTARGPLFNTIKRDLGLFHFSLIAAQLKPGEPVVLSENKIVFPAGSTRVADERELEALSALLEALDNKLSASSICSFRISRSDFVRSRKAISVFLGSSSCTEVVMRFHKKTQGEPRCEHSLIPDRQTKHAELAHTFSWQLDHFQGGEFAFSTRDELYKQLPPSDYQVTIYDSGVAEFIAMDHRVTFFIEEQKPPVKTIERRSAAS